MKQVMNQRRKGVGRLYIVANIWERSLDLCHPPGHELAVVGDTGRVGRGAVDLRRKGSA